ncbi:hypothetical protein ASG82_19435 [Mycobacterium sp. Soil538]|nr:hypothetical protein ASG82_19435 [Mycobacterium sp. Soil538]
MTYLRQLGALYLRYWPQLAACYLLGLLGRRGAIELAAWAGHDNDLWASLIMPLAGIARLGSYVAMFLVLRHGVPVLAALPRRPLRQIDLFATVIVPFFAIYLAWQMFREDWLAFESRALDYRIGEAMTTPGLTQLHPDALPVTATTWVVIGVALAARYALSWLGDKLPRWFVAVRVYVDALWVFLVLTLSVNHGVTIVLDPAGWLAERRIVVWFNDSREALFAHAQPLEAAWDAVMWALRTVFGGAAVPLIWLAVAGIVYGVTAGADWRATARQFARERASVLPARHAERSRRVQAGWKRLPGKVRRELGDYAGAQLGKFTPIADSARLLLHGGVLALSLYVLGYLVLAWLDMSGSFYRAQLGSGHLFRGMAWLLGPHPQTFWDGVYDALTMVSHLIVEPLRICLIAVTLGYCLQRLPAAATAPAEPGSPTPTR